MGDRLAVINPGSSTWWLLTLTPIIYFDQIRVAAGDLESIHEQEGRSYYNFSVSKVLRALERYAEEEIVMADDSLPTAGKDQQIISKAEDIAKALIGQAAAWSQGSPTIASPSELKNVMINAYTEWISYNQEKAKLSPNKDPLKLELLEKQIPRWKSIREKIKATKGEDILELLSENSELYIVFKDIIRNAHLITTASNLSKNERIYDVLAEEFLPAVSLVQRYQVFLELPEKVNEIISFDTLLNIYDLRMQRTAAAVSGVPESPKSIVLSAFRERERFSLLRKRLAEIDTLIQDGAPDNDLQWFHEIIDLARDLHKQIERIDKAGKAFMWASGAYFLKELLSTVEPTISQFIRMLLVNPITTRFAKETLKNMYLSAEGITGSASPAIAAIRDYIGFKHIAHDNSPRVIGSGVYEFWV